MDGYQLLIFQPGGCYKLKRYLQYVQRKHVGVNCSVHLNHWTVFQKSARASSGSLYTRRFFVARLKQLHFVSLFLMGCRSSTSIPTDPYPIRGGDNHGHQSPSEHTKANAYPTEEHTIFIDHVPLEANGAAPNGKKRASQAKNLLFRPIKTY